MQDLCIHTLSDSMRAAALSCRMDRASVADPGLSLSCNATTLTHMWRCLPSPIYNSWLTMLPDASRSSQSLIGRPQTHAMEQLKAQALRP